MKRCDLCGEEILPSEHDVSRASNWNGTEGRHARCSDFEEQERRFDALLRSEGVELDAKAMRGLVRNGFTDWLWEPLRDWEQEQGLDKFGEAS